MLKGAYIPSMMRVELEPLKDSETRIFMSLGYISTVNPDLFTLFLSFITVMIKVTDFSLAFSFLGERVSSNNLSYVTFLFC